MLRFYCCAGPYLAQRWTTDPINGVRTSAWEEAIERWSARPREAPEQRMVTLTLPTGMGKTLAAARWALTERMRRIQRGESAPRIIIALPYLSIVDQTREIYRQLLGISDAQGQDDVFMESHSISLRQYAIEGETDASSSEDFFLDTWRSEIIVTTFDQVLHAVFDPASRHLMRFHALYDALIVLDEVQVIPCCLWDPVRRILETLCRESTTAVLMMTATQPGLLPAAEELGGTDQELRKLFGAFGRYRLRLNHLRSRTLDDLWVELSPRIDSWLTAGESVMVVLNTRAAARAVYGRCKDEWKDSLPIHLITAEVTQRDRLAKIRALHGEQPTAPLVVATQCMEAGVDLDMVHVIRDFALLDSLIQVAGRCNRHSRRSVPGTVDIVCLIDERARPFCQMIYDPVLLACTREVLDGRSEIAEREVLEVVQYYDGLLAGRKDRGQDLTERFTMWDQWTESIGKILRWDDMKEHTFLVIDESRREDVMLASGYEEALTETDPWLRRRRLRALAPALKMLSVSVHARREFDPGDYAVRLGSFWRLRPGFYTPEAGLELPAGGRAALSCVF